MKFIYSIFVISLVLLSCKNDEKSSSDQENVKDEQVNNKLTTSELLSTRWVLKNRKNEKGDKSINFEEKSSTIVTFYEENGYFRVYDSIQNAKNEEGVRNIEQRRSGQWDVKSKDTPILTMRYTQEDTVIVEEYEIQEVTKNNLIIKSINKDIIETYMRKR